MNRPERPAESFDAGLQHERTALAWERTSIAMMVAAVVLVRYAATQDAVVFAVIGLVQIAAGAAILVWAGSHYEELHGLLRTGSSVVHPTMARTVGAMAIAITAIALVAGIVTVVR